MSQGMTAMMSRKIRIPSTGFRLPATVYTTSSANAINRPLRIAMGVPWYSKLAPSSRVLR